MYTYTCTLAAVLLLSSLASHRRVGHAAPLLPSSRRRATAPSARLASLPSAVSFDVSFHAARGGASGAHGGVPVGGVAQTLHKRADPALEAPALAALGLTLPRPARSPCLNRRTPPLGNWRRKGTHRASGAEEMAPSARRWPRTSSRAGLGRCRLRSASFSTAWNATADSHQRTSRRIRKF